MTVEAVVKGPAAAAAARTPCTKADYFERVAFKRLDREWFSYYGTWFSTDQPNCVDKSKVAIRAFKTKDEGNTISQMNVYEYQRSASSKPRAQDGHFDARFQYSMAPDASKAVYNTWAHDRNEPTMMLTLGSYDAEFVALLPMVGQSAEMPLDSTGDKAAVVSGFPMELFICDGPHRWGLCALYSKDAEPPLTLMVCELATRLDPEQADVLTANRHLIDPIRPTLEADPQEWVPPAARQGVRHAIVVDAATGDLVYLPPAACTFHPPSTTDTPTHSFLLLPDAGYHLLPRTTAWRQPGSENFWVEFGVRTKVNGCFRVIRVEYQPDGTFRTVEAEEY